VRVRRLLSTDYGEPLIVEPATTGDPRDFAGDKIIGHRHRRSHEQGGPKGGKAKKCSGQNLGPMAPKPTFWKETYRHCHLLAFSFNPKMSNGY
jgi:hypothetical protein